MREVFIIAEAGVNHNGSVELAKKLVDVAVNSGADAVKFQSFKAEKLVSKTANKAEYQKRATAEHESQFDMLKKLELDEAAHQEIFQYCQSKKIQFLSTPFDHDSVDLLTNMGMSTFKIPSGEITNLPYLQKVGRVAKRVILSTGMATLGEVESALTVLVAAGLSKQNITVLHATTEYPCPLTEVNLTAMTTMKKAFQVNVGYSDHTPGIEVAIAATALGACVIEKHFTLDRTMKGPDHKASLEPDQLAAMITAIRHVSQALGDGIKQPSKSEIKNMTVARKSIVALTKIKTGDIFSAENLTVKRPGNGISPMRWNDIMGQTASKNYDPDDMI